MDSIFYTGKESFVIEMPRGDMKPICFDVTDPETGELSDAEITEIYFTVKRDYKTANFLFQKRLSNGTIEKVDTSNRFQFIIDPADTEKLGFGDYVCDIELVGPDLKSTTAGRIRLLYEATHANNE